MYLKIPFLFFCMVAVAQGYSQYSLIGRWRRVDPDQKLQNTSNKKLNRGDLEIRIDSTFHIAGDTVTSSSLPGWYVGQEYHGKWDLRGKNALTLWLNPGGDKIPVNYIIIELTKRKLVLRSSLHQDDKHHDITYLRL
ncbi:hypothetical protein [Pollutibacter soli]|uniref:hypothetical protein n=1 Tax=Pollutibacter soli TaxID=3034157 RepID=UPI00301333E3